jgi:hypothetical protein
VFSNTVSCIISEDTGFENDFPTAKQRAELHIFAKVKTALLADGHEQIYISDVGSVQDMI